MLKFVPLSQSLSKSKSLNSIPFLKLLGKRIYPSPSVKYLGVRLDEHLNWKLYSFGIANKLQRACGALSKLRHYIPLKLLLNVYHAIFSSQCTTHVRYGDCVTIPPVIAF